MAQVEMSVVLLIACRQGYMTAQTTLHLPLMSKPIKAEFDAGGLLGTVLEKSREARRITRLVHYYDTVTSQRPQSRALSRTQESAHAFNGLDLA